MTREEAISRINNDLECHKKELSAAYKTALKMAIEALKQPERKNGKWIDAWRSAFDGTRHWYRECSECGYERDDDSIDKDTRFCPQCGADMRGEQYDK